MTAVRVSEPMVFTNDNQLESHLDRIRMTWKAYRFETPQLAVIDCKAGKITVYQRVKASVGEQA